MDTLISNSETQTETTVEVQEEQTIDINDTTETGPDELELLKQRARLMGITFSNNIGLTALRERINAKMTNEEASPASASTHVQDESTEQPNALEVGETAQSGEKPMRKMTLRQKLIAENMRLVRCRITCLDPKKKELPGEIFTVANEYIGTVRKYVPYGEDTDDGYHLPFVIYKQLEKRRFLSIRTKKDRRTGIDQADTSWAKEFAIEVLPQLTQDELDKLAAAQAASGSLTE